LPAFADIGVFMDQPMKNYSSACMRGWPSPCARMSDADILVVDEILSVGDAAFQQKMHAVSQPLPAAWHAAVRYRMTAVPS